MVKASGKTVLLLSSLLASCICALALDPSLDISQLAHTSWKIRNGFGKGVISSLAQTPDGYLWLGTDSGMFRFDGVRPLPWQPPDGQQLPGTLITNLLVTRDGTLWIGTFTGLANWKNGKLTQFPEFSGRNVQSLLETRDGTIWIGTYADSSGTLCDIQGTGLHCDVLESGVWELYEDRRGTLWVGLQNGLWKWKPGPTEFYSVPDEPFGISSIAEDEEGHLLFGSHVGIRRLVNGRIESYTPFASAHGWQVTRMLRDRDGALWVGTSQHGLSHIGESGKVDRFSHTDGLSGDWVTRIFQDREGSIWAASFNGLDQFRAYAISTISANQGLSASNAWSVLAAKDGSVWIGTVNGVNRWKDGKISVLGSGGGTKKSDGKLDGKLPVSFFEDSSGRVWVSASTGSVGEIGFLQDDRFTPISGFQSTIIRSFAEAPTAHLWAADQQSGLTELFGGRVLQRMPWTELEPKEFAKVIVADPSQRGIWLGFHRSGLVGYFADGAIRESYRAVDGVGKAHVADLRLGTDGGVWAATDNGLSLLRQGHAITLGSKNGLPCDNVLASIEDDDGSTWLYTACALVRIPQNELSAWIADPSRAVTSTVFDSTDGVRTHGDAAGGYQPLMSKSPDGRIWFVPWDGVSVIDPHHLPFNKLPPPVHIENIAADDKPLEVSNGMHLPTGVRHLDIDYTGLSLVVPEKVRFRVKLEGEDKDWRELVNVRHVEYTNLPPKHYKFRVLACNNSGVWNEEGAALDFVIPPAWYQTNWFRAACVGLFFAMLWGLHELRVRRLAHEFNMRLEERLAERTRIARDLHDTLLQGFQGLIFRFQAAFNQFKTRPDKAYDIMEDALSSADKAIAESRGAIHELRPSSEENNLEQVMLETGRELASSQKDGVSVPSLRVIVEGQRRAKQQIIRNEVYRIARELLRNAYRHAHAQNIEAELRYDDDAFLMVVRDDGRGIDPKVLKDRGRAGHWGLPGMYERAEGMGARLDFWSEVGAGTEVRLRVPAGIAYEKSHGRVKFKLFRKARIYEHRE